jgi:phosphoglycerate dehydrogenase-like enzyme
MYSETIRRMSYEPVQDLDTAVARADFITIHCPQTPETVGLFDAARLGHMKRTAFIVNSARGGIIDEKALYDALKASRIAGAALDVFDQEPTPQDNPLLTLPNLIAAPHVAGVTREAVDRMGVAAVENILSVLDDKPIRDNVVNKEVLDYAPPEVTGNPRRRGPLRSNPSRPFPRRGQGLAQALRGPPARCRRAESDHRQGASEPARDAIVFR